MRACNCVLCPHAHTLSVHARAWTQVHPMPSGAGGPSRWRAVLTDMDKCLSDPCVNGACWNPACCYACTYAPSSRPGPRGIFCPGERPQSHEFQGPCLLICLLAGLGFCGRCVHVGPVGQTVTLPLQIAPRAPAGQRSRMTAAR